MKTIQQARNFLLLILLSGFAFLFLLLLGQTITNKYQDVTVFVWLWFLMLYIPTLVILIQIKKSNNKIAVYGLNILTILFVAQRYWLFYCDHLRNLIPSRYC